MKGKENNKIRILFDMSHTAHGNTGIQQDIRYSLLTLMNMENVEISLMWYDVLDNYDMFFLKSNNKNKVLNDSNNISKLLGESRAKFRFFTKLNKFRTLFLILFKRKFRIFKIDREFNEIFYKKYLTQVYDPIIFNKFKLIDIYISNFCDKLFRLRPDFFLQPKLDTKNFDFIIFQREIPIVVNKNTLKIVRFYDLIQILNSDVVPDGAKVSKFQIRNIKKNILQNTFFLCISNDVKDKLLKYFPELTSRAHTIYVPVSDQFEVNRNYKKLFNIIENNIYNYEKIGITKVDSKSILNYLKKDIINSSIKFITYVGSIDSRKNIKLLIDAVRILLEDPSKEKYRIKLLLSGGIGWKANEFLNEAQNLIRNGDIIVLENPPTKDIPVIMSCANMFVFPSLAEGFGMPPIEAMLCEVPVISSDIPVHREIQSEYSWYFNPNSVQDLVKVIYHILDSSDPSIRNKIAQGKLHALKFTKLKASWENYIDFLSKLR